MTHDFLNCLYYQSEIANLQSPIANVLVGDVHHALQVLVQ